MSPPRYRLVVEGELGPRNATAFDGITARAHKARRRSPGRSSTDRISAGCSNGSRASASRCAASPTRSRSWRGSSASSEFSNDGERVVLGQWLMRAASDIFLGAAHVDAGLDNQPRAFYGRQLKDWKGSAEIEQMAPKPMTTYGTLCGGTLARVHARSGGIVSASCAAAVTAATARSSGSQGPRPSRTSVTTDSSRQSSSRPDHGPDGPLMAAGTFGNRSAADGLRDGIRVAGARVLPPRSPGSGDDGVKDRRKPGHKVLEQKPPMPPVWRPR